MEVFAVIVAAGLILFIIPVICGQYASTTGRSFWTWFIIACFVSFIALFILLMLPDKNPPENLKEESEDDFHN